MHFYGNNSSKTNYFVEKFVIVESSTITKCRFKNGKSVSAKWEGSEITNINKVAHLSKQDSSNIA